MRCLLIHAGVVPSTCHPTIACWMLVRWLKVACLSVHVARLSSSLLHLRVRLKGRLRGRLRV